MTKLYVANVPQDVTEHELRLHFATCGGVSDVEILLDRRGTRKAGLACVTMTSPAYATAALSRLNGVAFEGKVLRVSDSPIVTDKAPPPKVKIMQQFRERTNMTYDLDCAGVPMTVRIFPVDERWRVEARATEAADAVVVGGTGATREEAMTEVARAWNDGAFASSVLPIDGEALLKAMRDVKAI